MLAALGPRMIDLAGDRTQGALPSLMAPTCTAAMRERLCAGARLVVVHRSRRRAPSGALLAHELR